MSTVPKESLTEREQDVLRLIADGLSNKAIAEKLFLSVNTVAWYVQQIFSKLQVNRRTQAVAVARKLGFLAESDTKYTLSSRSKPTTSFIGRKTEISEILTKLDDDHCRLITLLGLGGIGKTRLALQIEKTIANSADYDVQFIALQPLSSAEMIVPSIASSIGLQLRSGERNPIEQLLYSLKDRRLLMVLDNFEHVLDGRSLVSDILSKTEQVKIIVTSREALNLQEEYLYHIHGLPFPKTENELHQNEIGAIELFEQRARQIRTNFSASDEFKDVLRICQLVDGIPLAIELATSWLKTLSCEEIADEIEKGLKVLVSPIINIPERHRSIKAVFDASWQRLNSQEQAVFSALSVFRGGCTRDAASVVANAQLLTLQSLVDKSLVQYDAVAKRYMLHELLRQYGEKHLNLFAEEVERIRNLHYRYYTRLLADKFMDTCNENQYKVMITLDPEVDNIRLSWDRAIEYADFDAIQASAQTLWVYFIFKGRFLEGVDVFKKAIEMCHRNNQNISTKALLAELQNLCGMLFIRLSRLEEATVMFEASHQYYRDNQLSPPLGWATEPIIGLCLKEIIQGNYDVAEALAKEARDTCVEQRGSLNLMLAYYVSTGVAFHQGQYEVAMKYAGQAYQQSVNCGEIWVRAEVLLDQGRIAREQGRYQNARHYFEQSLGIRDNFGDSQGVGAALNHLGRIALIEGENNEAKRLYQQSYNLYKEIGDEGGKGYALVGLGETACNSGEFEMAQVHFKKGIQIAETSGYAPLTFTILSAISNLMIKTGDVEKAKQILHLIQQHERSDHEAREKARISLQEISQDSSQQEPKATTKNDQNFELELILQSLW